ncbi:hypothetical protein BJI47_00520 [Rhodococcus sp. 1168]|nr:hypothetical protein BJI47_00520 [Rhodococcus sp. 1168]
MATLTMGRTLLTGSTLPLSPMLRHATLRRPLWQVPMMGLDPAGPEYAEVANSSAPRPVEASTISRSRAIVERQGALQFLFRPPDDGPMDPGSVNPPARASD